VIRITLCQLERVAMNIKVTIVLICCAPLFIFAQHKDKKITVTPAGASQAYDFADQSTSNYQFRASGRLGVSDHQQQALSACATALDIQCYHRCGMNYNAITNLMNYKLDAFIDQLLYPERFSDELISVLWQEYKRCGKQKNDKNIAVYEQKITAELQRRAHEKMQINPASQARSLLANQSVPAKTESIRDVLILQAKYDRYKVDLQDCPHQLLEQQYEQRQQAVLQTQQEQYQQHEKKYDLDAHTVGYLSAHGVNAAQFQNFYGTALQHQFHHEICTQLQQLSQLSRAVMSPYNLLSSVVHFADGASDSNKMEHIALTSRLINTNFWLLEFAGRYVDSAKICLPIMARAGVSSVTEFYHMLRHPYDTVDGLVGVMCDLIELSIYNDLDSPEIFADLRDEKNKKARDAIMQMGYAFADSSPEQKVELLSRCVADFCMPHKIIQGLGTVLGVVRTQARSMRTLEVVASCLSEELGAVHVAQEVALAAAELEVGVQEHIAQKLASELMQTERHTPSATGPIVRSLKSIMEETLQYKGIPLHRLDLYQEVKTKLEEIKQLVNKIVTQEFKDKYGKKLIRENGIIKTITMDLDHSLAFDFELKKRNALQVYDIQLKIGHSSELYQVLEETGIITMCDPVRLSYASFEYQIKNNFTSVVFPKTTFPKSWTLEKIVQSSWDIFDYGTDFITEGKPARKLIVDGVEMSIILKVHDTGTNVVTILPYVKIKP